MTNNNGNYWTDERLNQLAIDIEGNKSSITELRTTAEALLQIAQIHQQDIEVLSRDLRGLQLEVRRLVEEIRQERNGS